MTPNAQFQQWPDEVAMQPAGSGNRAGSPMARLTPVNLAEASLPSLRSHLDPSGEVPISSLGDWQQDWIEDA